MKGNGCDRGGCDNPNCKRVRPSPELPEGKIPNGARRVRVATEHALVKYRNFPTKPFYVKGISMPYKHYSVSPFGSARMIVSSGPATSSRAAQGHQFMLPWTFTTTTATTQQHALP